MHQGVSPDAPCNFREGNEPEVSLPCAASPMHAHFQCLHLRESNELEVSELSKILSVNSEAASGITQRAGAASLKLTQFADL